MPRSRTAAVELVGASHHGERRLHGRPGLDRLLVLGRGPEDDHQAVADVVVQGPPVRDRHGRHLPQVLVQHLRELLGLERVGQVGEPDHVREQERELPALEPVGRGELAGEQALGDLVRQEPLELAGPDQLGHLLLDPGLELPVEPRHLVEVLASRSCSRFLVSPALIRAPSRTGSIGLDR